MFVTKLLLFFLIRNEKVCTFDDNKSKNKCCPITGVECLCDDSLKFCVKITVLMSDEQMLCSVMQKQKSHWTMLKCMNSLEIMAFDNFVC